MEHDPADPLFILRDTVFASVTSMVLSDDELSLITGNDQGWISVWSTVDFRLTRRSRSHSAAVVHLQYACGELISQGRDGVILILSSELLPLRKISYEISGFCKLAVLNDMMALPTTVRNQINFYYLENQEKTSVVSLLDSNEKVFDFGLCMALKLISLKNDVYLLIGFENGSVGIFNMQTGICASYLSAHEEPIMDFDIDLNSHHIFCVSAENNFSVLSIDLEICRLKFKSNYMVSSDTVGAGVVKYGKNNDIIAIGTWDGALRIFEANQFGLLAILQFHSGVINCICISKSSGNIFSGSADGRIALWSIF